MPLSSQSSGSMTFDRTPKEKVFLKGAEETLFCTLLPKARDAASPSPILGDLFAQRLIDSCDVDLTCSTFREVDNERAIRWVVNRALFFDRGCQDFFKKHEGEPVTVLHLACGLDCRVFRTRPGSNVRWIDLDLQHVIDLRKRLITETPRKVDYFLRTLDVTSSGWMRDIPADQPTLIMAEGLFMYLKPDQVETAIHNIVDYFKKGELILDTVSNIYVTYTSHVTLLQASGAKWFWGTDDIQSVEKFHPALKMVDRVCSADYMGSKRFGQSQVPLFGEGMVGTLKMALASLSSSNEAFGQNGRFEFGVQDDPATTEGDN